MNEGREENPYDQARRLKLEAFRKKLKDQGPKKPETVQQYWERVKQRDPSFIKPEPPIVPTEHHSSREMRGRRTGRKNE